MCIISVYRKGLQLNKKELEMCFENNPDGSGLMFQENGHVHIIKGMMTWDEFWKEASVLPTNVDRVFHFRIATSGKVSQGICHPFPICNDYKKMRLIDSSCNMGMVHNGILSDFEPKDGMKSNKSDTMVFNKAMLWGLDGGKLIRNNTVRALLEKYTTSRFAIMDPMDVYLIGDFVQSKDSKAMYSNQTYKTFRYSSFYYGSSCYADTYCDDYNSYGEIFIYDHNYKDEDIEDIEMAFEDEFGIVTEGHDKDDSNKTISIYFYGGKLPSKGTLESMAIPFYSYIYYDESDGLTTVNPT